MLEKCCAIAGQSNKKTSEFGLKTAKKRLFGVKMDCV